MVRDVLSLWTIYARPRDFPDGFVARRWDIVTGQAVDTQIVMCSDTLDWLRDQMLDMGLTLIGRSETDEPQIVETWI